MIWYALEPRGGCFFIECCLSVHIIYQLSIKLDCPVGNRNVHNKTIWQICAYPAEVKQRYHKLPCNLSFCEMSHFNPNKYTFHIVMHQKDLILFLKVKVTVCWCMESLRSVFSPGMTAIHCVTLSISKIKWYYPFLFWDAIRAKLAKHYYCYSLMKATCSSYSVVNWRPYEVKFTFA